MLCDRLVCGINNERLLLAESKLTFKKALEIATSQETASKNVQTLRGLHGVHSRTGTPSLIEPVHMLKSCKQSVTPPEQKSKDSAICHRRWRGGHKASQCKFLKVKCHSCGKIGHLKHVCKSGDTQGSVNTVEDPSDTVQQQYGLYNVEDATTPRVNPYVVTLTVEGKQLIFEIDTGTSFSLVSEATYHELWPNTPLLDTTVKLNTYTGTPLQVLGVRYAGNSVV